MIQNVITRMGSNSFHLKGWSVVLVSALFALSAADTRPEFIYLAYFPAFIFWILDGYFLWQERLFRELYDHVRLLEDKDVDFSMDTSTVATSKITWRRATLSKTLRLFHGVVIGAIVLVMCLIHRGAS